MILNKKDTINFLNSTSLHPAKGSMKTISNMIEVGRECGYHITKIGVDQFEIFPNYFIRDYDKPVLIYPDLPADIKEVGIVDNKPWGKIFEDTFGGWTHDAFYAICHLFTLSNGDKIDINKTSDYEMALAQFLGYVREDKDLIYIYYYPRKIDLGYFDWEGKLNEWKR